MTLSCVEKPDVIELEQGETLTVASTYEMVKSKYELSKQGGYRAIKLKVYDNFFVVYLIDLQGKSVDLAFSDTWDFSIR